MPFNGSGTFTLAQAAFVPNTPISSSAMNSDLSDIATNGLTNAVTKDGQTTITGAFKGATGSVGLPMYSFSADTDSGMYRIAANNIGISVNATKILDIATTGLSVVGSFSPSTTIVNPVGTVSLPSYTFSGDLNSGVYWIGADNIGVAVNATKILDISTAGLNVIGTVSSNGAQLSAISAGAIMSNGTIVESHTGNAATFAIKTLTGADPSSGNPVTFLFRDVTAATGDYVVINVTAALSLTISSGSTVGFTSAVAARLWLAVFNDGGTVRLAVINCLSVAAGPPTVTSIYPLSAFSIASATSEGGAGGADSAQVFYANAAVTSKAYTVIGYASYESGLASAGAWAASPTRLQLFGPGVKLPGDRIQQWNNSTGAASSGTTVIPADNTIPQSNEGVQFLSQVAVPSSAANLYEFSYGLNMSHGAGGMQTAALFSDNAAHGTVADARAATMTYISTIDVVTKLSGTWRMQTASVTSTTFAVRCGSTNSGTSRFNSITSPGQLLGGAYDSNIAITEIMA